MSTSTLTTKPRLMKAQRVNVSSLTHDTDEGTILRQVRQVTRNTVSRALEGTISFKGENLNVFRPWKHKIWELV